MVPPSPTYRLRPATDDDKLDVLRWRNQPLVRAAMLTTGEIPLEGHLKWWEKQKTDPGYRLMIVERAGVPVAVKTYMNLDAPRSVWWGFYLTDQVPADSKEQLDIWAHVETAGILYPFDFLGVDAILCEVRKENTSVTFWHNRFGFQDIDPGVSPNTAEFALDVKQLDRVRFEEKRAKGLYRREAEIAFVAHPRDTGGA
ncbi:hypothetical protein KBY29_21740 [Ruegeria pomeroyi]|uniref:hypothetical protein n=1 Tax=Ruegeria pomeroyi TaxID=89184 RepID=UPI001F46D9F6|nr:hypothetical protein [Ruegeria pomeroyi]MCE8509996.1 hypothetical protein [Ruegeria pomeroyi]MCE8556939.1 hypothetical protein [Ruegeria pomeroyi]